MRSGRSGGDSGHAEPRDRERVIASVPVVLAARTLLLDVGDFAIRGDLAIVTCHAPACECREPEEANKAHHVVPLGASLSN